jgi:cell fate regulator YaaT (PSP1 superfamily)
MACTNCSTKGGLPGGCKNNGACKTGNCGKLPIFDWLANMELPSGQEPINHYEVRFKNGRKEFFLNKNDLTLNLGDVVAVESSPGHDIGVLSLKGELVRLQMRKKKVDMDSEDIKVLYRHASEKDIEKWQLAQSREKEAMYRTRDLAVKLNLSMKIGDVEFQGDNNKAIFYYTADGRVDFRELIKQMAEEFKIRIEMRQIGARQEAQRMGGIGSCGRELCCSTWLSDFRSVNTSAARYQQLSLNPQKLAGQCGKLKCCLNYELDSYMDALKDFPDTNLKLKTKKGNAFMQKMDIFRRKMWYSYFETPSHFVELKLDKVLDIIAANEKEELPHSLEVYVQEVIIEAKPDYENVVGQDSITRFDKKSGDRRPSRKKGPKKPNAKGPQKEGGNRPQKNTASAENKKDKPKGKRSASGNRNRPRRNAQDGDAKK